MDHMIPVDGPSPHTQKKLLHIEQVALQLFIASFDPMQIIFYAAIFFLLKNPKAYATLVKEIRDAFKNHDEITADSLIKLQYLHAFINETMRVHLTAAAGLPRISPGTTIDGVYVPEGVSEAK